MKRNNGYTLVEVVIAMTLIACTSLLLYGTMTMYYGMIFGARNYMAAESIAFDELWNVYNQPLSYFEPITTATNWAVPAPTNSIYQGTGFVHTAIFPAADGASWAIQVKFLSPRRVGGVSRTLSNDLFIVRYRTDR